MPKMEDVIKQMQNVLPNHSTYFNESFAIFAIASLGGNVFEFTTTSAHKLKTSDSVLVSGVLMVNSITGISASGGIITFTTGVDHDLTEGFHTGVDLEGFTGLSDGKYTLYKVPKKNTFQIKDASTPSGSGKLNEDRIDGVNGRFTITVTSTTKFTISAPDCSFTTFKIVSGTTKVNTTPRVTGIASASRIENYYSDQKTNDFWGFVVLESARASHDRSIDSDANQRKERSDLFKYEVIEEFSVYVVCPAKDYFGGRFLRDLMIDIRVSLCKTIAGVAFPSYFVEDKRFKTAYIGDQFSDYVGAYYVHRFDFESVFNFNQEDAVDLPDSRAFRRFELDAKMAFDTYVAVKKQVKGDLP